MNALWLRIRIGLIALGVLLGGIRAFGYKAESVAAGPTLLGDPFLGSLWPVWVIAAATVGFIDVLVISAAVTAFYARKQPRRWGLLGMRTGIEDLTDVPQWACLVAPFPLAYGVAAALAGRALTETFDPLGLILASFGIGLLAGAYVTSRILRQNYEPVR